MELIGKISNHVPTDIAKIIYNYDTRMHGGNLHLKYIKEERMWKEDAEREERDNFISELPDLINFFEEQAFDNKQSYVIFEKQSRILRQISSITYSSTKLLAEYGFYRKIFYGGPYGEAYLLTFVPPCDKTSPLQFKSIKVGSGGIYTEKIECEFD